MDNSQKMVFAFVTDSLGKNNLNATLKQKDYLNEHIKKTLSFKI
jgi:beta-lactamase class D